MTKTTIQPSGFQIAFLLVALLFLAAPAEKYLFSDWTWAREQAIPVTRLAIFCVAASVIFGIGGLRRFSVNLLSVALHKQARKEVAGAFVLNVIAGFAGLGAAILLLWISGGEPALSRRSQEELNVAEQMRRAWSLGSVLTFIVIGGFIAPVIEELLFRGMLYPAWARQWGWIRGAIATSLLFALIHPNVFAQFFASLIYIGIFRRTGSLRAPIIVHGLYNMSMWYPLLGQYVFPEAARGTGEISHWSLNIVCLAVASITVPTYLWISRDKEASNTRGAAEVSR